MEQSDLLKRIYADSGRLTAIADEDLNIIWENRSGALDGFSADSLTFFGAVPALLPITEQTVAEYKPKTGLPSAVEITPLSDCDEAAYLLQFYSCDDIERLTDSSGLLRFRSNYLGNIRSELSQIIFALDANRGKQFTSDDLIYQNLDAEARYRVLRTLSTTVNMNELSKYYNGFYKNKKINASDVLNDLCEQMKNRIKKIGCTFTSDIKESVYLYSNADRLKAAVSNLMINAIMYCEAKEKECILMLSQDKAKVLISVQDNGGSATQAQLDSFKEPFSAFSGHSEHESLGICVAASYCKAMGGKLKFVCCEGRFTRAEMLLPAYDELMMQDFRSEHTPDLTDDYDLASCIFAKGTDPF